MEPTLPRGYERLYWALPLSPRAKDELFPPGPLQQVSDAERAEDDRTFYERVHEVAELERKLKPWTLVELPGEVGLPVAKRRNLLMRVVTWWHNRSRRKLAAQMRAARAHYFAPAQMAARARASEVR